MKKSRLDPSQTLVKLGLTKQQAKMYQLLLEEGALTVGQIAKQLEVFANAVYRLGQVLINKRLVSVIDDHPRRYQALSPSLALKELASQKVSSIESLTSQAISQLSRRTSPTHETQINQCCLIEKWS